MSGRRLRLDIAPGEECSHDSCDECYEDVPDRPDRKAIPVCTGCLDYFPDALQAVARLSKVGNDKHNGAGSKLRWAKEKSADHEDALVRHLLERGRTDPDTGLSHSVSVAWRALALLQTEIESAASAASPSSSG